VEAKIKANIDKLIDQTNFLLEKQKESKDYCAKQFEEFLSLIEEEISQLDVSNDMERIGKLKSVADIINKQLGEFSEEIAADVSFLEDQLSAIKEISTYQDSEAAAKLIGVLMDGKEVPDTAKFKKDVESESVSSKESFIQVINDLKAALQEGGVDDLLAYLQSMQELDESEGLEVSLEMDDECCGGVNLMFGDEGTKCCGGKFDCGDACVCDNDCKCEVTPES